MKKLINFIKNLFGKKPPAGEWADYPETLKSKRTRRTIAPSVPENEQYRVESYTDSMGVKRTRAVAVQEGDETPSAPGAAKTPDKNRKTASAAGKKFLPEPFETEEDPQNPGPKSINGVRRNKGHVLSIGIISLFFLVFVFLIFIVRQSLYVSNEEESAVETETLAEAPNGRLETPLLGTNEQTTQELKTKENRFDFTPLLKTEILQTPVLPEKTAPSSADPINRDKKEKSFLDGLNKTALAKKETNSELLPPWRRNAIPTPKLKTGQKAIALVLSYDGKNPEALKLLKDLKYPLTVSFPAFLPGAEKLEKELHAAGYEILMSLPSEPKESVPPGIKPLMSNLTYEDIEKRFAWHMNHFKHSVGFKFMFTTALTEDLNIMSFLMATAEKRGVLYLNSADPGGNVSLAAADAMGTPYAAVDINIHSDTMADDLRTLYNKAQRYGYAVGSADLTTENLTELKKYIERMAEQETVVIPVSTVVKIEQIKKSSENQ